MKIAVLFDTLHPEWEDADYKKEVEAKTEEWDEYRMQVSGWELERYLEAS